MKNKGAFMVALGGMIAALSIILMLLAGLFPVADLAFSAAAGVLLIAAVFEIGRSGAFVIFAAVGILSILFSPDKVAAVSYLFFFGHYSILKNYIEHIRGKPLQWAAKLAVFNVCAVAAYLVSFKLLGVSDNILRYGYIAAFAVANGAFIIYDIALSRLVVLYTYKIRRIFKKL